MTPEGSTLGDFLRQEREKKGITIEQVASATKIGIKTLHSLEADHFNDLPATPFIRGFVISYCRFIGLDPKEVLAIYTDFIGKKSTERPKRDGGHSGYAFEKRDGEQQSRTFLFVAIFGFVGVGVIAVLLLKPSFHHHRKTHIEKLRANHPQGTQEAPETPSDGESQAHGGQPAEITKEITKQTTTKEPPKEAAKDPSKEPLKDPSKDPKANATVAATTAASVAASPTMPTVLPQTSTTSEARKPGEDPSDPLDSGHHLLAADLHHRAAFKVSQDLWVRYQVDDRPMRKFVIRAGKMLILRARDQIKFQVSDPDSIDVSYNNSGFQKVSQSKKKVIRHGEVTLFYPPEIADQNPEPFTDSRPLPRIAVKPETPAPAPAPAPSPGQP